MLRSTLPAALLATLSLLPLAAQSPALITTAETNQIQALVQQMGLQNARGTNKEGKPQGFFVITMDELKIAVVIETPQAITLYTALSDAKPTLESINVWNREHARTRAVLDEDGEAGLYSDIVVQGGITPANLQACVRNFRENGVQFARFLVQRNKK